MNGWTPPDRRHPQGVWWVVTDAVVAALFTWITVVSLRSDAYVDLYGPVNGAGWLLALSPNALLLVRSNESTTEATTARCSRRNALERVC